MIDQCVGAARDSYTSSDLLLIGLAVVLLISRVSQCKKLKMDGLCGSVI